MDLNTKRRVTILALIMIGTLVIATSPLLGIMAIGGWQAMKMM